MRPLYLLALVLMLTGAISSCQKSDNGGGGSSENKLKDSSIYYARLAYLWYKDIPSSFNARSYEDPNAIMEGIRQYSSDPNFSGPVDRWSFAVTRAAWQDLSQGISKDFGLGVFFFSDNDLRVSYVEPASPAGAAKIKRGWQIKQINGNSNISTSNIDLVRNTIFGSTNITLLFGRAGALDTTISMTAASYTEQPIILDSIYNTGATKTGYLVFNSFLGDTNQIRNRFQTIFNKFTSNNVSDVVLDLRYNGGGYVLLQDELANYLVPNGNNGSVMEKQQFNDILGPDFNETTTFTKKGTLNLNRLFVIVSQNSASASELLINSLRPYMNVQLVGPSKTHGKPVGYFPIPVMDWMIFPVSFRTVNKNNEGSYYAGFTLNHQVRDGLDKGWGDINENCLAAALKFIGTGTYPTMIDPNSTGRRAVHTLSSNEVLGAQRFRGSIILPKKLQ